MKPRPPAPSPSLTPVAPGAGGSGPHISPAERPRPSDAALDPQPRPVATGHAAPGQATPGRAAVVIQTSFLGDVILTTPLLAALAEHGPVDVVTTPAAAPLLARDPSVRAVIVYDKRGDARGISGLWQIAQALKARFGLGTMIGDAALGVPHTRGGNGGSRPESLAPIAYLAQSSVRSGMLALLAGFPERVGFSTSPARALYSRTVPYRADRHHAERLWRLGASSPSAEPSADAVRPRLYPDASDLEAVDHLLTRAAVGGPPGTVIDATGALSILAAAELIRRCAVIVTNDSAPQHLASAMGTPTVAIFGPTIPEFGFGPMSPRHAIAGVSGLECRPCDKHGPQKCPLGHWHCMRELTVAFVEDLVRQMSTPATS